MIGGLSSSHSSSMSTLGIVAEDECDRTCFHSRKGSGSVSPPIVNPYGATLGTSPSGGSLSDKLADAQWVLSDRRYEVTRDRWETRERVVLVLGSE